MSHVLVGCALELVRWTPEGVHVVPKAGGDARALIDRAARLLRGRVKATADVPIYSSGAGFRVEPRTVNEPPGSSRHAAMALRALPQARLLDYED